MFNNYLKVALRTIIKKKGYSLINIIGLGIAFLAILFQTLKAATANPVDSLRYE